MLIHRTTKIVLRSLWVQGYTAWFVLVLSHPAAFPVGTGIYREWFIINDKFVCVPCGYRDIPKLLSRQIVYQKRSLWVQGYTAFPLAEHAIKHAFPVGTGIYRKKLKWQLIQLCVPCGYRDIPLFQQYVVVSLVRSLWVQGYTACPQLIFLVLTAFPVGTGIYRNPESNRAFWRSVPCGYRDIPIRDMFQDCYMKRSLWVQGYTCFNI